MSKWLYLPQEYRGVVESEQVTATAGLTMTADYDALWLTAYTLTGAATTATATTPKHVITLWVRHHRWNDCTSDWTLSKRSIAMVIVRWENNFTTPPITVLLTLTRAITFKHCLHWLFDVTFYWSIHLMWAYIPVCFEVGNTSLLYPLLGLHPET